LALINGALEVHMKQDAIALVEHLAEQNESVCQRQGIAHAIGGKRPRVDGTQEGLPAFEDMKQALHRSSRGRKAQRTHKVGVVRGEQRRHTASTKGRIGCSTAAIPCDNSGLQPVGPRVRFGRLKVDVAKAFDIRPRPPQC
jgi:hypothetical protein